MFFIVLSGGSVVRFRFDHFALPCEWFLRKFFMVVIDPGTTTEENVSFTEGLDRSNLVATTSDTNELLQSGDVDQTTRFRCIVAQRTEDAYCTHGAFQKPAEHFPQVSNALRVICPDRNWHKCNVVLPARSAQTDVFNRRNKAHGRLLFGWTDYDRTVILDHITNHAIIFY